MHLQILTRHWRICMTKFNQDLYYASIDALVENGVPKDVAERASEVVATDDPKAPGLGRTDEDRQAIAEAMKHYWSYKRNNGGE